MKYETNVWYGWNGGECPVHPETVVQVQMANETREQVEEESPSSAHCAGVWSWDWDWACDDVAFCIIAFRIVKERKVPREVWMKWNERGGYWSDSLTETKGAVLFREVLE